MKARLAVTFVMLLFLFAGCSFFGGMDNIPDEARPDAMYAQALETFNSNVRVYLNTRSTVSKGTQDKWKAEVEPLIDKVKEALDTWGLALDGGISTSIAKAEYDKLFTQFLAILLKFKIVEIKK